MQAARRNGLRAARKNEIQAARSNGPRAGVAARRNGLRAARKNEWYRLRACINARHCKMRGHKRTDAMEKITIRTDTNHLLSDGYKFRKDRTLADGSKSFRCCTRNCCGRLKVGVHGDVISSSEHNHETEQVPNEIDKAVVEILRGYQPRISAAVPSTIVQDRYVSDTPENAKKMILIEPRMLNKYEESKTSSKLDDEMREILRSEIEDAAKGTLYSSTLSRYLKLDKSTIVTKSPAKYVEETTVSGTAVKQSDSATIDAGPRKRKSIVSRNFNGARNETDIADILDVDSIDDAKLKRISSLNSSGWWQLVKIMKDRRINSAKERNATAEYLHASSRVRAKRHRTRKPYR